MDIDENKSGCAAAQEERGSPPEVERTREPQGHEELLERGGLYRQLYETQFRTILDYEAGREG